MVWGKLLIVILIHRPWAYNVFAYNCSSFRVSSEFEKQVGQGLCVIVMVLLDSSNSPIQLQEPVLPLLQDSFKISVALWPHETLKLDNLTQGIFDLIKQTKLDLYLSAEIGDNYRCCKSEDSNLDDFDSISSLHSILISEQKHPDISNHRFRLNIEGFVSSLSNMIFNQLFQSQGRNIILKNCMKVNPGKEVNIILAGVCLREVESPNNGSSLSSDVLASSRKEKLDSLSFTELFALQFFIIAFKDDVHISSYRTSNDFIHNICRLAFRWTSFYDIKNQRNSPIAFPGLSLDPDSSYLAAIDAMERHLSTTRRLQYEVDREIQLHEWTSFPLLYDPTANIGNTFIREEWYSKYQNDILLTFSGIIKEFGYSLAQNLKSESFWISPEVSKFQRYFYKTDEIGILHVIQSHIRGDMLYLIHYGLSKIPQTNNDYILQRLVNHLFETHVKLTIKLLDMENPGLPCLLESLRRLNQTFPKAPFGSRTFLVKHEYHPGDLNVSTSLFQYIFMNPFRYGFSPVSDCANRSGCYLKSKTPDFRTKSKISYIEGEEIDYILIVYYNRDRLVSDTEPILKFYIIVVNLKPLSLDEGLSASEYIGGGYYLGDIVKNAEKRISDLLNISLKFYSRDSLWNQLNKLPTGICMEKCEWIKLFLDKIRPNSRSFLAVDPNLQDLFSYTSIDWIRLLNHLCSVFNGHILNLTESVHLIIYNQVNSDYLVLLSFSGDICGNIVSREGISDPVEWEEIDRIVNEILRFLLEETSNPKKRWNSFLEM